MKLLECTFVLGALIAVFSIKESAQTTPATYPNFPSETPATFQPVMTGWEDSRREVMIPMRDGVRLHTVILVPKGAKNAPILLTRTPYEANRFKSPADRSPPAPSLSG